MKPLDSLDVTASAEIVQGTTTNRVKPRRTRKPKTKGRYKREGQSKVQIGTGRKIVQISLSVPEPMLTKIDEWAERVQMSRSRFMVTAAVHFAAKVMPP